jgi:hypothetical protein
VRARQNAASIDCKGLPSVEEKTLHSLPIN